MAQLIVSFIGEDRPGLVQALSDIVAGHGGNWEESRMVHLGGHFSGCARVDIDAPRADALQAALAETEDLTVTVRPALAAVPAEGMLEMKLDIVGPDRKGILRDVTTELGERQINVQEMNTSVGPASMSGSPTFSATASVMVPSSLDLAELDSRLSGIAENLGVDILLES